MIINATFNDFCDSFTGSYADNFSYAGKRALFDYLEELEESTGEQIELDPIALCCEYTEYESLADFANQYNGIETMEDIENETTVIKIEGSNRFIAQDY